MTREEALKVAREHVTTLSTNARGYQDGVTLRDKVAAVETFARYLTADGESADGAAIPVVPEHRAALVRILKRQLESGPEGYDAAAEAILRDMGEEV